LWLHSLKVAQLLRSAACLHTNQSRSYLIHLVQRNIEALSYNYYSRGKAMNVAYSEYALVAVGIQHEMRMRYIVICSLSSLI